MLSTGIEQTTSEFMQENNVYRNVYTHKIEWK